MHHSCTISAHFYNIQDESNTKGIASKYDMTELHPYYKEWQEHQATIKSHRNRSQLLRKKIEVTV
jgi:hypothetical protein